MADSKAIAKLDQKLIKDNTIDPSFKSDYKKVHSMLNSQVRKSGKILTEELFKKGDAALRKWLMTLSKKGASQERLTSYLRCGLAHLCYDFIESTYETIPLDDLIARVLKSFKQRNYHKSFFKTGTAGQTKNKKAVKKKIIKKKAVKTKTTKKKTNKKKVAKKKTVKKAVKKKVKSSAKKPAKKQNIKSIKKKSVKQSTKKTAKKAKATSKKTRAKKPKSIFDKLFGV